MSGYSVWCPSCHKLVSNLHEDRVHNQLRVWHAGPHVLGDTPCMWPIGGASFAERDRLRARVEVLTEALNWIGLRECQSSTTEDCLTEFPENNRYLWCSPCIARAALAAGTAPTEGGEQ